MGVCWIVSFACDPCSYGEQVSHGSKEFGSLEAAMSFAAEVLEGGGWNIEIEEVEE
jgi:hypothetical protein